MFIQSFTQALFRLGSHPEWIKPMRDEVETVIAEEGWTKAALQKMRKIDSFLKENQRIEGLGHSTSPFPSTHPSAPTQFSALAPKDPDTVLALRVCLCAEEVAVISIDPRTGQITLRDTGDLAAPDQGLCFAGPNRGLRFLMISERVNTDPVMLFTALMRLRLMVSVTFGALWMQVKMWC